MYVCVCVIFVGLLYCSLLEISIYLFTVLTLDVRSCTCIYVLYRHVQELHYIYTCCGDGIILALHRLLYVIVDIIESLCSFKSVCINITKIFAKILTKFNGYS